MANIDNSDNQYFAFVYLLLKLNGILVHPGITYIAQIMIQEAVSDKQP